MVARDPELSRSRFAGGCDHRKLSLCSILLELLRVALHVRTEWGGWLMTRCAGIHLIRNQVGAYGPLASAETQREPIEVGDDGRSPSPQIWHRARSGERPPRGLLTGRHRLCGE